MLDNQEKTACACSGQVSHLGTRSDGRPVRKYDYPFFSFLRTTPFDTSTDEGRSKERYRRIVLTSVTSFVSRAVLAGCALVSVRLALNYLGAERYGRWLTIPLV